jgi:hypothetical protein
MSGEAELFLGVIALATTVMAVLQVGMAIQGARLARRVNRLFDELDREIRPLLGRLQVVSADLGRMTALAVTEVERADQVFTHLAQRLEQLLTEAQQAIVAPARQGFALLQGIRAGLAALRGVGAATARRVDQVTKDEEALFIG